MKYIALYCTAIHSETISPALCTDIEVKGDMEDMRWSTVQYNTVQYSTIQYNTVQYSTVN